MLATWGCATFPKPTLDLQFAGATSLDSRITFTRASTATYFNSAGVLTTANNDVARFDYDPSTLAARGLLIEEARTNSYTYSEELNNPAWTASGVTVSANAAISPAGTMTADNIIPSASATIFKELQQNFSVTLGTTYTFSVFAKSNGYRYVQLIGTGAAFGSFAVNYDLDTGTETAYTAGTSTVLQRSITPINNGWYRLSVSVTSSATNTTSRLACDIIPASDSARGVSWTGDGTSGVLMWGMQVEAGAFPTSYIPTTTTALTRSADAANMTGANFSSWYNAAAGTIYAEASVPVTAAYSGYVYLFGIFNDGIQYYRQSDFQPVNRVRVSSSDQFLNGFGAIWNTTGVFKNAQAYVTNDFAGVVNGGSVATDTSGTVPTVSVLNLGSTGSGSAFNGYLRRISYYPSRLPNTTLQALTA